MLDLIKNLQLTGIIEVMMTICWNWGRKFLKPWMYPSTILNQISYPNIEFQIRKDILQTHLKATGRYASQSF
jgi:hypothetical protein